MEYLTLDAQSDAFTLPWANNLSMGQVVLWPWKCLRSISFYGPVGPWTHPWTLLASFGTGAVGIRVSVPNLVLPDARIRSDNLQRFQ